MQAVRVRSRHFNSRQPSGLNNLNLDCGMSLLWGGGGGGGGWWLMHEGGGGVFAEHYGVFSGSDKVTKVNSS